MNIQESRQFQELILRVTALEIEYQRLKAQVESQDLPPSALAKAWQVAGHKKPGPKPKHGN